MITFSKDGFEPITIVLNECSTIKECIDAISNSNALKQLTFGEGAFVYIYIPIINNKDDSRFFNLRTEIKHKNNQSFFYVCLDIQEYAENKRIELVEQIGIYKHTFSELPTWDCTFKALYAWYEANKHLFPKEIV
jgi:hypothetical protein